MVISWNSGVNRPIYWFCLTVALACSPPEVRGVGQYGRPIPLVANDDMIPRLVVIPDQSECPGESGPCSTFYDGPPSLQVSNSCRTVVLDTGTVLSAIPVPSNHTSRLERECLEVRSGQGSEAGILASLEQTVTRFRFEQLPLFRMPTTSQLDEYWQAGVDQSVFVGGVIGANLLRNFAIRFRHVPSTTEGSAGQTTVQIYGLFPGSETNLANRGLAYIRTQYPNRLLGRQSGDRCSLGPSIDCKIDQLFELDAQDEQQIYESSRMVIDTCIAPPRCGVFYGTTSEEPPLCVKNSSNPFILNQPLGSVDSCLAPTDGIPVEGQSASMIPVTSISGAVLFSDSFARMFGSADNIPLCDEMSDTLPEWRVCRESSHRTIHVPGWPTILPELTLRIRAIALVAGLKTARGSSPCRRLAQRMEGLLEQCKSFSITGKPTLPDSKVHDNVEVDYRSSTLVIGDVYGDQGSDNARNANGAGIDRWISTVVISSASQLVRSIRADVSGIAIEPDGLIGTALLRNNDIIFDYTEEESDPGIRARCLRSDDGSCVSLPVCAERDEVGQESCCFGLPQNLLKDAIMTAPDSSQICCSALSSTSLAELQERNPPSCIGIAPP